MGGPEVIEEWRPVIGHEGKYEVSSLGRARSVDHVGYRESSAGERLTWRFKGRVLKLKLDSRGYLGFTADRKTLLLHRHVALAFIPNPDNKPQVNHKNRVKTDNRVENLEWCTRQENVQHMWRTGAPFVHRGESHCKTKLFPDDVLTIRQRLDAGDYLKDVAADYGMSISGVAGIKYRISWKHI